MKLFWKNILRFGSIFIVLNFVFYYCVFKPAVFEKYIYNEHDIGSYNKFLLADSHGAYLEDRPNKSGIFNFSNSGENYFDMYLKVEYLSKKLSEEDTILISLDNHLLSKYRDVSNNLERNVIYSNDYQEVQSLYSKREYYFKKWLQYLPFCQVDYNQISLGYLYYSLRLNKIKYLKRNYGNVNIGRLQIAAKERYKYQFGDGHKSFKQLRYLNKIIDICKKKNIILIGIRFPVTKEYWRLVKENDFGAIKLFKGKNLQIIDLHNLFFDDNQYFADVDHLNVLGGKLFCDELEKWPE